jgi:hypothetical protein
MNLNEWQPLRKELYEQLARWCGTFPERGALCAQEVWRRG